MAKIEILAPFIFSWEGGFSNHPLDKGGATNKGITLATYKAYCKLKGYPQPTAERLQNITEDTAHLILKALYWDKCKAEEIESQAVANILVDWYWHSGVVAIKHLQRLVGVADDGIVGPLTLSAINRADPELLFSQLWNSREDFLRAIVDRSPSQELFLRGWLRRLNSIEYNYLQLNSGGKIYF